MAFGPKEPIKQKIIATVVDPQLHNRLKMYALYKDTTMSGVILKLIKSHIKTKPSEKRLVTLLAEIAYKEWDNLCILNAKDKKWQSINIPKRWDEWVNNTKVSLLKKEINEDATRLIILELEQMEINR